VLAAKGAATTHVAITRAHHWHLTHRSLSRGTVPALNRVVKLHTLLGHYLTLGQTIHNPTKGPLELVAHTLHAVVPAIQGPLTPARNLSLPKLTQPLSHSLVVHHLESSLFWNL
jgi:hypothetical protein